GVLRLDAVAHLAHARLLGRGILAAAPGLADGLRGLVAQSLEVLDLLDDAAALGVAGEDLVEELSAALVGERGGDGVGLIADQLDVQHWVRAPGVRRFRRERASRPRRARSSPPCRRRRGR